MVWWEHIRALYFLRCEMCACLPYEMEHLSEEFTNGSSSDATGNNRRFQAENLRQITIYQLMKPLKIIPPILLCPLSSALHYLHKHWLHSEERIWHESQLHCSYYIRQSDNSKKKKKGGKKGISSGSVCHWCWTILSQGTVYEPDVTTNRCFFF